MGCPLVEISTLKNHKLGHTGENPFACTDCGKSFSRLSTLKNHKLVHTGEKPFACTDCGKSFSRLSTLKNHKSWFIQERNHLHVLIVGSPLVD